MKPQKTDASNAVAKPKAYTKSTLNLCINESYLQIPAKEGKNSLFLVIEDFELNTKKDTTSGDKTVDIKDTLTQVFVAQQFDQTERYELITLSDSEITGLNSSHKVNLSELKVTLNENYITLLSKVIDWNIDDMQHLISKVKQKDEGSF
jgi:hypothetical protein